MLAPCWFTLWTSKRFLYPYIPLISLEIFLFSCLCPFFFEIFGAVRIWQDNVFLLFLPLAIVWFAFVDNCFLTCNSEILKPAHAFMHAADWIALHTSLPTQV